MSASADAKEPLFGAKAAFLLGGVFLCAFLICAGLVGTERGQRTRLEAMVEQWPDANIRISAHILGGSCKYTHFCLHSSIFPTQSRP